MSKGKKYVINILLGVDQFFNTILGGDPDETISSRAGKREGRHIIPTALCWLLNLIDKDHCRDAIEHDEGKDSTYL